MSAMEAPINVNKPMSSRVVRFAALPWRRDRQGNIRILMVTSMKHGRWIVPKGSLIKGKTQRNQLPERRSRRRGYSAISILYRLDAIHMETLSKGGPKGPALVTLFALRVRATLLHWPEKNERTRSWQSLCEAVEMASEPDLARILKYAKEKVKFFAS